MIYRTNMELREKSRKASARIHFLETEIATLRKEKDELISVCKDWVAWFDYCAGFQKESLIVGQTLESASENWNNMDNPDPSPSIENMRTVLAKVSGWGK